jgi:RNA 2',3'-cyclic 3'-phosphodiesterase
MRLFFAFELPAPIKSELSALLRQLRQLQPSGVKWVEPENLHITLQFLDEVDEADIGDLDDFFTKAIQEYSPVDVRSTSFEFVPGQHPRLVWARFSTEQRHIFTLPAKIVHYLEALGYTPDKKPLKLHVTLGRFQTEPKPALVSFLLSHRLQQNSGRIEEISLYKSTLRPQGPIYTTLYEYALTEEEEGR